jgi:hypothetical protein
VGRRKTGKFIAGGHGPPPAVRRLEPRIERALAGLVLAACVAFPAQAADEEGDVDEVTNRISPTRFRSRFAIRNEYQDEQRGGYTNFLVPRVAYAFSPELALRVEIPFVAVDPDAPGRDRKTGFGNLSTRLSWRMADRDAYALVIGGELILDTATDDALGSGKNVVSPFAFASIRMPELRSFLFPYVQYYTSVSGDDARPDVHYTLLRSALLTIWGDGFYSVVDPHLYLNHGQDGEAGMNLEVEAGRFLNPQTMLYLRPGVGVFGDNVPQIYNWNFEVGLRYFFN